MCFFWQVRQEANKPIDGFVNDSYILRLNSSELDESYSLEGTQKNSTDSLLYMNISAKYLLKKSDLEAQKQATEVSNKKYSADLRASVDFEHHLVNFANIIFLLWMFQRMKASLSMSLIVYLLTIRSR